MTHADEAALVEGARTDPAAFGVLHNRYVGRIYAYALCLQLHADEPAPPQLIELPTPTIGFTHPEKQRPAGAAHLHPAGHLIH